MEYDVSCHGKRLAAERDTRPAKKTVADPQGINIFSGPQIADGRVVVMDRYRLRVYGR